MKIDYSNFSIPEDQKLVPISEEDCQIIHGIIQEENLQHYPTIETGLAYGGSAFAIMNATTGKTHTAIDRFQHVVYKGLGLKNLAQNGIDMTRLIFEEEFSEIALPDKIKHESERFGFAFIDADHSFEAAFVDFFYLSKLVRVGGVIAIHDTWLKAIQQLRAFIVKNQDHFEEVLAMVYDENGNLILASKPSMFFFKKVKKERESHYEQFKKF
jgi:cephalosporin hydroxylase